MQADELVIRARRLDGQWENLALGQDVGILPESVDLSVNLWGPDRASFTLQRDPEVPRLDLAHDTPIEVEDGGAVIWDGRIMEAPAGNAIAVASDGWQYALDDFTLTQPFVHHDLSAWKDMRSFLTAELGSARACASGVVNQEDGALLLQFPKNVAQVTGAYVGVVLDAGPEADWRRGAIEFETSNNNSSAWVYLRGHTAPDSRTWAVNDILAGSAITSLGAAGARGENLATPSRYLLLFLYWGGAGATPADDVWIKVKGARMSSFLASVSAPALATEPTGLGDAAYVQLTSSRLRGDHVLAAALERIPLITSPGTYESASFRDEVLGSEALYAYYRFQEAAGATVAVDASGNARHGTIVGAPTLGQARLMAADAYDPDPVTGQSILIPSVNAQRVDVPTFDPTNGFTVEAVVRTPAAWTAGVNWATVLSVENTYAVGGKYITLMTDQANWYWGNAHTAGWWAVGPAIALNRTYYILAAFVPHMGFHMVVYDTTAGLLTVYHSTAAPPYTWTGGATPLVQVGNDTTRNAVANSGAAGLTIDELAIYQQAMIADRQSIPSTPMPDARRRALAALNREVGEIKRTGFVLPSFAVDGKSPRELVDAENALHGYQAGVVIGPRARQRALPTAPLVKIGDWPGSSFEDTSNNNGRDVINSARVVGTDPAGNPIVAVYSTGDLPDAIFARGNAPQPSNPSFDVNALGWNLWNGVETLTRDTGVFDTAPASGQIGNPTASANHLGAYTTIQGLTPGKSYVVTIRIRSANLSANDIYFDYYDGNFGPLAAYHLGAANTVTTLPGAGVFYTLTYKVRPISTLMTIAWHGKGAGGAGPLFYIDTVALLHSQYTVLDRQGGYRQKTIQTTQPITQPIANRLAYLYLLNNMTTPFKGTVEVEDGGMRGYLTDEDIGAKEALGLVGEILHVADRWNPDTGSVGRDGRIVSASFSYKTGKAKLALDSERGEFAALMARYGVRVS